MMGKHNVWISTNRYKVRNPTPPKGGSGVPKKKIKYIEIKIESPETEETPTILLSSHDITI